MTIVNDTIEAGGATPPATVKVWDLFVRVFHWSLATLFVVAYATGDEIEQVHIAAGYAIAGLLALRIVWGFVGPRHARFGELRPAAARGAGLSARRRAAAGRRAISATIPPAAR